MAPTAGCGAAVSATAWGSTATVADRTDAVDPGFKDLAAGLEEARVAGGVVPTPQAAGEAEIAGQEREHAGHLSDEGGGEGGHRR